MRGNSQDLSPRNSGGWTRGSFCGTLHFWCRELLRRLAMRKSWLAVLIFILSSLAAGRAQAPAAISVVRLDPALDELVPKGATLEKVGGDFIFTEGPVWVHEGRSGSLLFSDIPANVIRQWNPDGKVSVFLEHSGFTGTDSSDVGGEYDSGHGKFYLLGSNAVTVDREGRVVFCAHGDRAIVRVEKDGKRTVLADRYEGQRLNSPNDLVFRSDGALYFTDPSAGLRQRDADPKKELPFQGVYLVKDGKLQLLTRDLALPN